MTICTLIASFTDSTRMCEAKVAVVGLSSHGVLPDLIRTRSLKPRVIHEVLVSRH
jgi:hypothetical protein